MTKRREIGWPEAIVLGMVYTGVATLLAVLTALLLLAFAVLAAGYRPALSQTHHHRHHASYQSWVNKDGKGCCNNQDCGELADADEREDGGRLQVRIEGEWCDVEARHYLSAGNVPNAAVSHVCVSAYYGGKTPCEKFICYQPKPRM